MFTIFLDVAQGQGECFEAFTKDGAMNLVKIAMATNPGRYKALRVYKGPVIGENLIFDSSDCVHCPKCGECKTHGSCSCEQFANVN